MLSIKESYEQAVHFKIKINLLNITILSAYFSTGQSITDPKFQSIFQSLDNFFIIGGDCNSKHT